MINAAVVEGISNTLPDLEAAVGTLIFILQIVGGILGFIVIYWFVLSIINIRKLNVLNKILDKLDEISNKLDTLEIKNSKK